MPFWLTLLGTLGFPTLISGLIGAFFAARFKRIAFEHQVKFSALHERRAKAVADTYATLVAALEALNLYIGAAGSRSNNLEERRINAFTKYELFENTFSPLKIYFSKNLAADLTLIGNKLFAENMIVQSTEGASDVAQEAWKTYESVKKKLIEGALKKLEMEMRKILGTEF